MLPPTRPVRDLEWDFQAQLGPEKIRVARHTTGLAGFLYLAFGALDVWAIPSALNVAWVIRTVVLAAIAATLLLTLRKRVFLRHYALITGGKYVVLGLGIEAMIFSAAPTDIAFRVYYSGLLLVVTAVHTWTFLSTRTALGISVLLLAIYLAIALGPQGMLTGDWALLISNCFFFVSTIILAYMVSAQRERYLRENYMLRYALSCDLEATEEERLRSHHLARHDVLTGLGNRVFLSEGLDVLLRSADATMPLVAVILIDLDKFKPINDVHGHGVGDRVLQAVGERLRSCVRAGDVLARVGGDEFVAAMRLPSASVAVADLIASQIADRLSHPIRLDDLELKVGASIGIAIQPAGEGATAETILEAADEAMYEAKRSGRSFTVRSEVPVAGQRPGRWGFSRTERE